MRRRDSARARARAQRGELLRGIFVVELLILVPYWYFFLRKDPRPAPAAAVDVRESDLRRIERKLDAILEAIKRK